MILVNGSDQSGVDPGDRGLSYGDGLFETLAVSAGQALEWEAHLERLGRGCARLGIPPPDPSVLAEEATRIIPADGRGVLKIILTRGSGGRGYRPPSEPLPTRILALYPWPDYAPACYREGVAVRLCETRLGRNPALAGLKHLNRLEQVLARSEWADEDIAEGLMLDEQGQVIEGTMSNLFVLSEGRLHTPALEQCGVAGIVRARVLEVAASLGIETRVAPLRLEQVLQAQEAFLSNSLIGIWPIRTVRAGAGRVFGTAQTAQRVRDALLASGCIAAP